MTAFFVILIALVERDIHFSIYFVAVPFLLCSAYEAYSIIVGRKAKKRRELVADMKADFIANLRKNENG